MELDPVWAGTPLREHRTVVGAREAMNFAAAVADANPAYFEDDREGGVIAPPMMAVALTWPVLGSIWDYIAAEAFPREVLATQVHHTEHLAFHRPARPGEALAIGGTIAAVLPHRAGTRVVIRLEARDADGRAVFTEHLGALLRGVACRGAGRGGDGLPAVPDPPAGGPGWEAPIPIPPLLPFVYDGCTGIHFPIHTSRRFAREVGLPGIILQGTATLALAAREIVDRAAGGDPARLRQLACRFTGMVPPGTAIVIRCTGSVRSGADRAVFFEVRNSEGHAAVKAGCALISGSH